MEHCTPQPRTPGISLPVLAQGSHPPRRESKMGWKRALVLTAVWVLMIAHLVQWLLSRDPVTGHMSATLAPVEPSEGMKTVKDGVVTMGAVFFLAALTSTAILGRWFCGWGCHVVALQDGTRWLLHKVGVKPKPFRSRLLIWIPFLLGFYMFLWPLVYRFAIAPWVNPTLTWPGLTTEFTTNEYWSTFPGVLMAVPFLFICGCFIIYLLGSKGYCTYACPYGGFFAPLDELAPMRIVVDADKCHQCGHCTAVCTSNVRVHEEVRDYGMVIDPGCMKCMDCVSVCPNDALSFGMAKPAVRVKREGTRAAEAAARRYDLTWHEEVALFVLAVLTFLAVRGIYVGLPLLFASGVTMCVVFVAWKAWRTLHDSNSAFHQWQLRFHGRWRLAGAAWVTASVVMLIGVAYIGVMNGALAMAERHDLQVNVPPVIVYSEDRTEPPHDVAEHARAGLRYLQFASMTPDGFSVLPLAQTHVDLRSAWLQSVLGDFPAAEVNLRKVWERDGPSQELAAVLGRVIRVQGERLQEAFSWYEQQLAAHPTWQDFRQEQMNWLEFIDATAHIVPTARAGLAAMPNDLRAMRQLSLALVKHPSSTEELEEGVALIRKTLEIEPDNAAAYAALGGGLASLGRMTEAVQALEHAAKLEPGNQVIRTMLEQAQAQDSNPFPRVVE